MSSSRRASSPTGILEDRLPVRLQIQLHKYLWGNVPGSSGRISGRGAVSGGLDSATALAIARERGFICHALSVDYGQRHAAELDAARRVARAGGAREHRVMGVDLAGIGGSALTDLRLTVPETPRPAYRSLMFRRATPSCCRWRSPGPRCSGRAMCSSAVNVLDSSGYPDCSRNSSPLRRASGARHPGGRRRQARGRVHTPLITLTKGEIVREGTRLGVDYSQTVSCYQADAEGRALRSL